MKALATQIALVTGGSSGLGREISRLLLERNVPVCIVSRNEAQLQKTLEDLPENRTTRLSFSADIANPSDIESLSIFLQRQAYSVKWLFNNAGQGFFGPLQDYSLSQIESMLAANLLGVILTTQKFIQQIIDGNGVLCNIMSTAANIGKAEQTIYCAAKWGAKGFTEALRVELKGKTLRIVAVYPGGMKTPFWAESKDFVNLDTFIPPEYVAECIVSNIFDVRDLQVSDLTINRLP